MISIREIKKITRALAVHGDMTRTVKGVAIDSRTLKKGEVFIAVRGARFDGHDFIKTAVRKGAAAVIVSKRMPCPQDVTMIRVDDTTKALGQIAAWYRAGFSIPVIAITGSAGKTTAKDMIAAVLSKKFKVLKNAGTENNHFGVPLTLLKLNASYEIAVLELGTNQPGDISWLAKIVAPTVSVFTNIGDSHLERLKTRGGVFREKAQLVKFMDPLGKVIFNNDDPFLKKIPGKCGKQKIIRFGHLYKADHQATNIDINTKGKLQFKLRSHKFALNTPALHNVYNALAAISCGVAFKISYNDIASALNRFKFRGGRQEIRKIGRFRLIDDTYNANPLSFRSAIATLDALPVRGKRIIICADMLELGWRSQQLHRSIGDMISGSKADIVLTFGKDARQIAEVLRRSKSNIKAAHFKDFKDLKKQLSKVCQPQDAALVKGSRGMRMERAVTFIEKHLSRV